MAGNYFFIFLTILFTTGNSLPLSTEDITTESFIIPNNFRLPDAIRPIHYNIKLIPHIAEETIDGAVSIDIEIQKATTDIILHASGLVIKQSDIDLRDNNGSIFLPKEYFQDATTEMSTIRFETPLNTEIYNLNLKYTGSFSARLHGVYKSHYIDDDNNTVWLAATHFQPTSARQAFPCWDEPAFKATFNVSIKHHANYTALSNMPAFTQSDIDEADGMVWTHFETTPVMSTHILAFVVSDYVAISNENKTVNVWSRKNAIDSAKFFLYYADKAMAELERYTNSTVRVPKMDHVALPHYSSGATENWGLVTYREEALLYNESVNRYSRKESAILICVHELTHMWFGNLVSPSWWKYMWLSEGFAAYFKSYMADKILPEWRLMDLFIVRNVHETAMRTNVYYSNNSMDHDVDEPSSISSVYSFVTYYRAPAVIHMLNHFIGENVFRDGLIRYLNANQYSNTIPDDLWDALQNALDESDVPHADFTIKEVMDTWTKQSGYPLITVTRDYNTGEAMISQELYNPRKNNEETNSMETRWWVPINFATQTEPNFASTLPKTWLRPNEGNKTIEGIKPSDWIIVNIQETGFYRVNYDDTNWKKIAEYLNSDNYDKIHVLNRAQLLEDGFSFLMNGRLNSTTFLKLTNYLSREVDYIPWVPMFRIFRSLSLYNVFRHPVIKEHTLHLLENLVRNTGFEERPDDSHLMKLYRPDIIDAACKFGHADCRRNATAKLITYLNDSHKNRIAPDYTHWTFCNGLREADETTWNKVLELYKQKHEATILSYLSCSEDPIILENFLNITNAEDSVILDDHKEVIWLGLCCCSQIGYDSVFNFIVKHAEKIKNTTRLTRILIWEARSKDQLDKVKVHLKIDVDMDEIIAEQERALFKSEKVSSIIQEWLEKEQSDYTLKESGDDSSDDAAAEDNMVVISDNDQED